MSSTIYLNKNQIFEVIFDYLNGKNYNQAILIDGEWGCGKTYFIRNFLIPEIKTRESYRKIYEISLYGLADPQQIIDKISEKALIQHLNRNNLIPFSLNEKSLNLASKVTNALMSKWLGAESLPKFSDISNIFDNAVLIFDDLERASMNINQIFGFINDLVEHNDLRVIIVGNEKEIGKINLAKDLPLKYLVALDDKLTSEENEKGKNDPNRYLENITLENPPTNEPFRSSEVKISQKKSVLDKLKKSTEELFSSDILYEQIKEKLIGFTIKYKMSLQEVLPDIIQRNIISSSLKEYLLREDTQKLILRIFEEENSHNLRILISSLTAFEKFYNIITEIQKEKATKGLEEAIQNQTNSVLDYCVVRSIQIKSGKNTDLWVHSEGAGFGKYVVGTPTLYVEGSRRYRYKFVDDYLLSRSFDEEYIKKVMRDAIKDELDSGTALSKLENHHNDYLEDKDIRLLLTTMLDEFNSETYNPQLFARLLNCLAKLNQLGFTDPIDDQYVQKNYLDQMDKKLDAHLKETGQSTRSLISSNYHSYIPAEDSQLHGNTWVNQLIQKCKAKSDHNIKRINDHIDPTGSPSWGREFENYCYKHKIEFAEMSGFLHYLDVDNLLEALKNSSSKDLKSFLDGFMRITEYPHVNYTQSDLQKLNALQEGARNIVSKDQIIKSQLLQKTSDYIREIIRSRNIAAEN